MLIGITMGDASGLGPEILLRSVANDELSHPFLVFGDLDVLEFAQEKLELDVTFHPISSVDEVEAGRLNVLDCRQLKRADVTIGKISAKAGNAAVKYVQAAVEHLSLIHI